MSNRLLKNDRNVKLQEYNLRIKLSYLIFGNKGCLLRVMMKVAHFNNSKKYYITHMGYDNHAANCKFK